MNRLILTVIMVVLLAGCQAKVDEMVFTGSIEADEIDLSSEVSGIIEHINVSDGDQLDEGTVLVQMKTDDYESQLALLENAKAMAELSYLDLKDGNSRSQIKSARASVENMDELIKGSEIELTYLNNDLTDTQVLVEAGAASEKAIDEIERLIDRENAKLQGLKKQRELYRAQLESVLEGATDEVVERAKLQIEQKEIEIKDLNRVIGKSTLISPIGGFVQNVNYQVGEWLMPGSKAITIIDTSRMWIKVYVPEKHLHKIYIGQSVEFLDSFVKDQDITGQVSYISSVAEFTPKNIESKENKQEMVFEVRILVNDPSGRLKPGMFLDVRLAGE